MGTTSNYVEPAASITTTSNYVKPQFSNYVTAPAAAYVQPTSIAVQPQATSVFNAIDTNHDGKISRAEFSNYVMGTTTTSNVVAPQANYYNVPSYNVVQQPAVSSVFNTIDTNHDGKISRAEFSNYVMGTTSNYVKPAAPIATILADNYVKPAATVATYVQQQAVPAANSYYVQPQAAATSVFNTID